MPYIDNASSDTYYKVIIQYYKLVHKFSDKHLISLKSILGLRIYDFNIK